MQVNPAPRPDRRISFAKKACALRRMLWASFMWIWQYLGGFLTRIWTLRQRHRRRKRHNHHSYHSCKIKDGFGILPPPGNTPWVLQKTTETAQDAEAAEQNGNKRAVCEDKILTVQTRRQTVSRVMTARLGSMRALPGNANIKPKI